MRETTDDACHRCGYNLTGIANQQPCPECGLLAERSRRVTDELHQSRPRWLRRMSWGIWLILLAVIAPILLPPVVEQGQQLLFQYMQSQVVTPRLWRVLNQSRILPYDAAVASLCAGVLLLASREGFAPADCEDARGRRLLQVALGGPLVALTFLHLVTLDMYSGMMFVSETRQKMHASGFVFFGTLGSMPLPILLARRLKKIAARSRNAHMTEHCTIVGYGVALALFFGFTIYIVTTYAQTLGLGDHWIDHGVSSLSAIVLAGTACLLFMLWTVYLMIRFAITLGRAARDLRRQWQRDDRSNTAAQPNV